MPVFFDRVMESTTVTGTGDITPTGTFAGFRTFGSVMTDGDTFDYSIFAVDGDGAPTGDWEVGTGTWNAGVIERTAVQSSSNADAAVNFSAGDKHVLLTVSAATLGAPSGGITVARLFKQSASLVVDAAGSPTPVDWAASEIIVDAAGLFDDASDGFKIPAGYSFAEVTFNVGVTLPTGVPTMLVATINHSGGVPSMTSAMVEDSVDGMTSPQAALSVTTGPVAVSEDNIFTFTVDASETGVMVVAGPWTFISIKVW